MADKFRSTYRPLTLEEADRITRIKDTARVLDKLIYDIGVSRESNIALTKLEEAVMWAVKAASA